MRPEFALELYKSEREKFMDTRGIQWKLNFSVWTLLVVGVHFVSKSSVWQEKDLPIFIAAAVILITCHFFCVIVIQRSLLKSDRFCENIQDLLNTHNLDVAVKTVSFVSFRAKDILWIIMQTVITMFLVGMLIFSLCVNLRLARAENLKNNRSIQKEFPVQDTTKKVLKLPSPLQDSTPLNDSLIPQ